VLPTELALAVVEFQFVGVNRVCVPPETPLLFWWEAPTARALTCSWTPTGRPASARDIGGFGT